MMRLQRAAALLLVFHLSLGAFSPLAARPHAENRGMLIEEANATSGNLSAEDAAAGPRGLRFRLSEGVEGTERPAANPTPMAAKLSESEAQKVLARLPPLKANDADGADFNFREKSLPPPRTGRTTLVAFPAATERDAPDMKTADALQVARYTPSGEVPLAPQLSVTFSQAMVAITSHAELAAEDVPVKLTPQPAGKWRWVGTKTLVFDPADERLPMATEYAASVAAGTKSANGATLKTGGAWTFSTPAPQVKTKFPEGQTVRRDALMFIEFDQRIDPAAVLRTVRARGGAGGNLKLRLATDDEIAADENVRQLAKSAMKNRWLAFRAIGATNNDTQMVMPADSNINVSIGPDTPSAEGSRVTTKAREFSFRTFGRLRVTEHRCGWEQKCSPFDEWWIVFSNNLDAGVFDKSQVRIAPELPDAKIIANGNQIHIGGLKRGRTSYKVTLDGALKDEFSQTLGDATPLVFNVGSAPPSLASSSDGFVVLDPASAARFSVYSVNHNTLKVSLYSVAPEDWEQYGKYLRYQSGYERAPSRNQATPPGKSVFSKVIAVKGKPDELTETRIDLAPALKGEFGQVVVLVESTLPVKRNNERQIIHSWVQVTNIGLDAFVDRSELVGWATSLKDGRPLANVEMTILPTSSTATTGSDGLARLALEDRPAEIAKAITNLTPNLLVARQGGDYAILPKQAAWWNREVGWIKAQEYDSLRWYVFDDRKMYRPGEEVSVKGWIRRIGGGVRGDVGALGGAAESVTYTLRDSRGNEITKGAAQLNALGGFDTKFKLPPTMNLGGASLSLEAQGGNKTTVDRQHHHSFQVQEFRRPEFEVTTTASEGPHFVKEHAGVTINAAYYAGGGLPNAEVNWSVTSTPGNFTPPNRGDFTFGKWTPWWGEYGDSRGGTVSNTQTFTARTDAAGKHHLRIDFDSVNPPQASTVTAQASVTDVNRQAWTATTAMLVHPADLYVGLRSERMFVQGGEPLVVESIVTDLDGKAVANREVKIRAVLLDWTFEKGAWVQKETNPQECTVRSANDAVKCALPTKAGGVYRVTARVFDDRERPNESELTLWVAGGKQPPQRDVTQQKIELIPDRKEYQAGETAEILLQAPFYPAEGVMSLRRSGIVRTERFQINEPSHTLRIPIDEAFTPNVHVQVDLVGAAVRTDDAGQPND
ncbi:MAG TPA: MG2 domain-containing protein, partial [Pyrinomonadaceae bacterium]|nr:MG2 domain-containing protein [Pyrinomonadaceae bacterium]